ncbi:MAG: hypothetical protein ACXVWU_05510 [Nocardioides sp.]
MTGVMGGLVWLAAAVRGWAGNADPTLVTAGLVLFGVSLAAAGYALVRTAPLWLRLVVMVATPSLGYMIWITARDAFTVDHTPVLVFGVLMVTAGLIGLGRHRGEAAPAPVHGRRAAR